MVRLTLLLIVAVLALVVYALVDCLFTDSYEVRGLPKSLWLLVIALTPPFGPIAWLLAGRPRRTVNGAALWHPAGTALRRGRREVAPDDDPEFLRGLAARTREDERRRRDEERRRRETAGDSDTTEG